MRRWKPSIAGATLLVVAAAALAGCKGEPAADDHARHGSTPAPAGRPGPSTLVPEPHSLHAPGSGSTPSPAHTIAGHGAVHPLQPDAAAVMEPAVHSLHGGPAPNQPPNASSLPDGYAAFALDPARMRAVGLTTARVAERDFSRVLRTLGTVTLDETRTSHVHAKVAGWIETIHVDFIGKSVRRGQPLVTMYSQQVYAAQLEFLSILNQPAPAPGPGSEFAAAERQAREQLIVGARKRLALWDVSEAEVRNLERTRTPRRTFTLAAPRTGIVLAKQAIAGMFVDPSVELYLISDIRKLWVLADVYAADVPALKLGAPAQIRLEGVTGEPVPAKVSFVPPTIDEATRTLKVRFEIDNAEARVRPGAFATVQMELNLAKGLAIPEDAVIHAGPRAIVFVVNEDRVQPRAVVLGPNVQGQYRVERGLNAGERVATGAQFLLDSESRLRASSAPGGAHAGH